MSWRYMYPSRKPWRNQSAFGGRGFAPGAPAGAGASWFAASEAGAAAGLAPSGAGAGVGDAGGRGASLTDGGVSGGGGGAPSVGAAPATRATASTAAAANAAAARWGTRRVNAVGGAGKCIEDLLGASRRIARDVPSPRAADAAWRANFR